jgi:hypothetical protein
VKTRRQNARLSQAITQSITDEFTEEETGKPMEDLKKLAGSKSILDGDLSKIVRMIHQPPFWQPVCS